MMGARGGRPPDPRHDARWRPSIEKELDRLAGEWHGAVVTGELAALNAKARELGLDFVMATGR